MYTAVIVDDELKICQLIRCLGDWEKLGIEIIDICQDGETAVESILRNRPDIVLTDIRMPVYDGLEIISQVRERELDTSFIVISGYRQFEYIGKELSDIFALADLVISRAGANSICELLALHKPNILIPLSANASRGDQILNAQSFEKQGYSVVVEEEIITPDKLLHMIHETYKNRERYIQAMKQSSMIDSVEKIVSLIEETAK